MPWTITGRQTYPSDIDAFNYVLAVEAADGQVLEASVKSAINSFVLGCKADGIWNAIKASCILAGARTLNGALVPLKGAAPTNFNFVAGDYNRKTGLVGNGSTKYLDSNRNDNADPQNSFHLANYITAPSPGSTSVAIMGVYGNIPNSISQINTGSNNTDMIAFSRSADGNPFFPKRIIGAGTATGLVGASRSNSAGWINRVLGVNYNPSETSVSPTGLNMFIFCRNTNGTASSFSGHRLAFYSIGEALDLALLDARVTTLMNAFAALP